MSTTSRPEVCHNAEPGTFGHECGKPSTWRAASKESGFISTFCDDCKERGWEAKQFTGWERI